MAFDLILNNLLGLQVYCEEVASDLDSMSRKIESAVNDIIDIFKEKSGVVIRKPESTSEDELHLAGENDFFYMSYFRLYMWNEQKKYNLKDV